MSERTQFTAYITKFALSGGIKAITVEDYFNISPTMVGDVANRNNLFHRDEWHRTPEAALARAEKMRADRIKSLEKSLATVKALRFTVPARNT